ncbi:MAG: PorT family protein [Bacteroidales bacterium]|nr:PorT family protein [Bacteroidales bacterium]
MNRNFKISCLAPLILLIVFLLSVKTAYSQETPCVSKLKKAQELFDNGLIEEIPSMLDSCLKIGFNKEQTIQAYRLLIQVYLFDYNQEKAENAMLALLSKYPEYELQTNDPVEFTNLYRQFQTIPLYSFSVNTGLNFTNVSVLEHYSTNNLHNLNSEYKPGGIKTGIRLSFEKYINTHSWITLGLGYTYAGYEVEEQMNFDQELLSFTEKMQQIVVPHYYNYSFGKFKKFTPYAIVGGQFNYLLKSKGEIARRSLVETNISDLSGVEKDITDSRIRASYSVLAGVGIRYKVNTGYIRANFIYTKGLTNYIKDDTRYSDKENLFYYNFIDDKIKLNNFAFTIGYSYIFYKTVKNTVVPNNN